MLCQNLNYNIHIMYKPRKENLHEQIKDHDNKLKFFTKVEFK